MLFQIHIYIHIYNLEKIQLDSTIKVQFCVMCHKLFIFREFYFLIWSQVWDHIINIHLSELLRTKTKKPKINEHKKKKKI